MSSQRYFAKRLLPIAAIVGAALGACSSNNDGGSPYHAPTDDAGSDAAVDEPRAEQRFLATLISNLPGYAYRCKPAEDDDFWCM